METLGTKGVVTTKVDLRSDQDVVRLRQLVRDHAIAQGFSLIDQTKFVTAVSELARNTLLHGGGGASELIVIDDGSRKGLRLRFIDQGPGIRDIDRALQDGFTTGGGLGLGLGGARRLSDEFSIDTELGKGTTITIAKWKYR